MQQNNFGGRKTRIYLSGSIDSHKLIFKHTLSQTVPDINDAPEKVIINMICKFTAHLGEKIPPFYVLIIL